MTETYPDLPMVSVTINRKTIMVPEGTSRIQAIRLAGEFVPTLCEFYERNHHPGTCRVCIVGVTGPDGKTQCVTSCDTRVVANETIVTKSATLRDARKRQVEHIFDDHCEACHNCARHGMCELQDVAREVGLSLETKSGRRLTRSADRDFSAPALVFTPDRCIRCLRCVDVCREMHGIGAITVEGVGTDIHIGFDGGAWGDSDRCIQCGQCAKICPTGALAEKSAVDDVLEYLDDPEIVTVIQIAPAARLGVAQGAPDKNDEGKLRAAFKQLGADFVMDTRWAADVTIMEEATELAEHLTAYFEKHGTVEGAPTFFTSCCPAWVNHVEKSEPDMMSHLSSTRSPQAIFGALAKHYLPKIKGIDPSRIRVVSVMPCTAKKDEAARSTLRFDDTQYPETDRVLTVREVSELWSRRGIRWSRLKPMEADSPLMSETSGAGQLFGATGGVLEAALRTLVHLTGGTLPARPVFEAVRGMEGIREASVETPTLGTVRVAVAHTIRAAKTITQWVREGTCPYQFVEVMACQGGCSGGGGMPRTYTPDHDAARRQAENYVIDETLPIRCAHDNPDVQRLYTDYLGHPGSELAHHLLHCTYESRHREKAKPSIEALRAKLKLL